MNKQTNSGLIASFLLTVTLLISTEINAQNIEVNPINWNFGDIELGNSDTKSFRISSIGPTPLTINEIFFTSDSSSSFILDELLLNEVSLIPTIPPSLILPIDDFLDLLVRFNPDSLGLHTASINIISNAVPPDDNLFIQLSGSGVQSQSIPEPTTLALLGLGLAGIGYKRHRSKKVA